MAGEFWLDDQQWASIAPLLPTNQPGAHRTDDRRVISGIIHVLRSGCRWQDCPACYGPPTTIYNRFHRWSARGIWRRLFEALVQATDRDLHMIDSTSVATHPLQYLCSRPFRQPGYAPPTRHMTATPCALSSSSAAQSLSSPTTQPENKSNPSTPRPTSAGT